ncbi:urokinase plasminogen activator surface receptor-like [Scomber scombrus]|uniref:urokinase plasminogen activator surface receptor-like n=1 Tax=Scomber scombrus TaxID=13677 RepID=UPI002DDB1C00|nr:urokinase plasminogen activator surface receptor-like [Scomber scombrus]
MKLILSLTLIWTLSSTAEALSCLIGEESHYSSHPCNPGDRCATVAAQGNLSWKNKTNIMSKLCVPSSLFTDGNHTFSLTAGGATVTVSVHVCNTDGCNKQAMPYPGDQKKNNLQCLTCDDPSSDVCDKTVQCEGNEDRCINGTISSPENDSKTLRTVGCASANLCEAADRLKFLLPTKFLRPPKCHGHGSSNGNNSVPLNTAWSVKLNVITLLFGLITLIFY